MMVAGLSVVPRRLRRCCGTSFCCVGWSVLVSCFVGWSGRVLMSCAGAGKRSLKRGGSFLRRLGTLGWTRGGIGIFTSFPVLVFSFVLRLGLKPLPGSGRRPGTGRLRSGMGISFSVVRCTGGAS